MQNIMPMLRKFNNAMQRSIPGVFHALENANFRLIGTAIFPGSGGRCGRRQPGVLLHRGGAAQVGVAGHGVQQPQARRMENERLDSMGFRILKIKGFEIS